VNVIFVMLLDKIWKI